MDSTDIKIKQPIDERFFTYTNRKQFCSVKLQLVCDAFMKLIDIGANWPGSMADSAIFAFSSLGQELETRLEGTDFHLLSDAAYALTTTNLTPFRNNGRLNRVRCYVPFHFPLIVLDFYF